MLELRSVDAGYGTFQALFDVSLEVKAGEAVGVIGPNGAGKTTTLRMVAGLLKPTSGSIRVFGVDALADPAAAKQMIAWAPDEPMLYDRLNAMEYLEFVSGLWGVDPKEGRARAESLLKLLGLWDQRSQRCEAFSRGMKQKAALAGALIHEPRMLILDEPLTGLNSVEIAGALASPGMRTLYCRPSAVVFTPFSWPFFARKSFAAVLFRPSDSAITDCTNDCNCC